MTGFAGDFGEGVRPGVVGTGDGMRPAAGVVTTGEAMGAAGVGTTTDWITCVADVDGTGVNAAVPTDGCWPTWQELLQRPELLSELPFPFSMPLPRPDCPLAELSLSELAELWLCELAELWLCELAELWLCELAELRLRELPELVTALLVLWPPLPWELSPRSP